MGVDMGVGTEVCVGVDVSMDVGDDDDVVWVLTWCCSGCGC